MKPPPRARKAPNRIGQVLEERARVRAGAGRAACQWRRAEQLELLKALKGLHRTAEPHRDLDCSLLEARLPGRPPEEVRSALEQLKQQVISSAARWLQQATRAERRSRKPIEKWTQLAAAVTGGHGEVATSALSQVLLVASTEPGTLRHCVPPVDPWPARRPPPTAAGAPPAGPAAARRPLQTPGAPGAAVRVPSTPPAANAPPTLAAAPASSSAPPTAARASRTAGPKDVVDFERIYCFLSRVQEPSSARQPGPPWQLSPMESAVVLDLLMSLPEELQLLDCNQLHRHLSQVCRCLSAPRDSEAARQAFAELRAGLCRQAAAPPHSAQLQPPEAGGQSEGGTKAGGQSEDGTKAGGQSEGGTKAGGQSEGGTKAGGQSEDGTKAGGQSEDGTKAGGQSEGGTKAGGQSEGGTKAGGQSEGGTKAGGQSEDGTKAGGQSEGGTKAGGQSEGGTKAGGQSEDGTKAGGQSEDGTKAGGQSEGGTKAGGQSEGGMDVLPLNPFMVPVKLLRRR
ncbi:snRNA-activating protein complex subunit 2 isoform X1 [Salarias fasciatus]|uniref:snRNA-activating protein complex subunit 2-like n=1 Tax=Salarias fasciatus TaxID=181472 RepID=A0A672GKY7_SALFA|nr:snRNA-activating protein complex subunit 2-like isoform X1 [Salarias fasciatus]XP_029944191.1 snRNA-activating protein complex subunit 2-like isoform X1 [Salarias fasciatus]